MVFVTWPSSNALKIEAYCQQRQARELVSRFGGRVTKVPEHIWTGDPARPRAPLSIRGKLKVFSDQHQWRQWKQSHSKVAGIFIPAGMAFGTGEHATTATCLRLLADIAGDVPANFTVLDLGTGAGILAIAAKALGAGRVAAVDFDRVAVRIARQNAFTNGFSTIRISHVDVLRARCPQTFRYCPCQPLQRRLGPSGVAYCPSNPTWRVVGFLRCPPQSSAASRRGFRGRGVRKPSHHPPRKMVRGSVPESRKFREIVLLDDTRRFHESRKSSRLFLFEVRRATSDSWRSDLVRWSISTITTPSRRQGLSDGFDSAWLRQPRSEARRRRTTAALAAMLARLLNSQST